MKLCSICFLFFMEISNEDKVYVFFFLLIASLFLIFDDIWRYMMIYFTTDKTFWFVKSKNQSIVKFCLILLNNVEFCQKVLNYVDKSSWRGIENSQNGLKRGSWAFFCSKLILILITIIFQVNQNRFKKNWFMKNNNIKISKRRTWDFGETKKFKPEGGWSIRRGGG